MGGGILLIRKVCVFMEKENNRNDKCNKCNKFNNRVKYILLVLFGSAFICAAFFIKYMFYSEPYEGYDMTDYVALPDYGEIIAETVGNTSGSNTDDKENAEREKVLTEQEQSGVWQDILISSEVIKYPMREKYACRNRNKDFYEELARSYGYENDDFEKFIEDTYGWTTEEYKEFLESYTESTLKEELVIHAIAQKEDLKISEEEYGAYLDEYLDDAGYTPEEYEETFGMTIERYAKEKNLETYLLKEKVFEHIFN